MELQMEDVSGNCNGCGLSINRAYRVSGLAGFYCSVLCIEGELFGHGRCRWCGRDMEDKIYPKDGTVRNRLCSDDCAANYFAKVAPSRSDGSAAAGSGVRLGLWMQERENRQKENTLNRKHKQRAAERPVSRQNDPLAM